MRRIPRAQQNLLLQENPQQEVFKSSLPGTGLLVGLGTTILLISEQQKPILRIKHNSYG
jgi:hypothetical protein